MPVAAPVIEAAEAASVGGLSRFWRAAIDTRSIVPAGRIWRPWNVFQYLPRHALQFDASYVDQGLILGASASLASFSQFAARANQNTR
jgi:hypothetical protein